MSQNTKRNLKRRRGDAFPEKEDPVTKFSTKLHHLIKDVKRSAKKAKTFETQKIVKKLKSLRNAGDSVEHGSQTNASALEIQLDILKAMDHESIGVSALRSKLKAEKTFSKDPAIAAIVAKQLGEAPSLDDSETATLVRNRLLSSKYLADEVKQAVRGLREILLPKPDTTKEVVEADLNPRKKLKPCEEEKEKSTPGLSRTPNVSNSDGLDGNNSDSESVEIPPEMLQSNFGSDGWESGSIHGDSDGSEAEDDGGEDEDGNQDSEAPKSKTKRAAPGPSKSTATSSSTFLPSLSVGYIQGDSSDPDFSDEDVTDLVEIRKNRRGQRARRAIWEKKFGKNANHVKTGAAASREQKSDKSRASKGPGGRFKAGPQTHRPSSSSRPSGYRPQPSRETQDGPPQKLHPSWEAKRKLKEQQSVGIVPSQGKKITFS